MGGNIRISIITLRFLIGAIKREGVRENPSHKPFVCYELLVVFKSKF